MKTLVFVPPGFVLDVYTDIIKEYAKTNNVLNEMSSFFTYFEATYIGKKARNGRVKRPLFPIDMWSMFYVLKKHTSTTNNSLEAFNGNFNECQPGHQTIYSALEGFKREVEFTEIKHSELTSGKFSEPQAKRKKLKDEKYNEITLIMSYMEKLIEVNCK